MTADDLITVPELARLSGATERQIRYWTDSDVIDPARAARGQGYCVLYHPNIVPVIATLARISAALPGIRSDILARIADRHADGVLEIAPNIVLIWEPPPPLDDLLTDQLADQLLAAIRDDPT